MQLADHMIEYGLASEDELKAINKKIQGMIDDALEFATSSPEPDPNELYRYIFAEDE